MTKKVHKTKNAPEAIGPYSQAIEQGEMVYCSGQLPIDMATGNLAEGIANQTRAALQNLSEVLQAAGSNLSAVLKTTVFMTDLSEFDAMNKVYAEFFPIDPPARSTVQVAKLPKGASVEIDAIGFAPKLSSR